MFFSIAEDIDEDGQTNSELAWYLEIMNGLMNCDGKELLPYKEDLKVIFRLTLHLKCKKLLIQSIKVCECSNRFILLTYCDSL